VLPAWAWCWLAAASVVGFALAVADKRRARSGRGRVPEKAFHALALLGGWPGELVGFALARHKTRKPRFLVPFVLCSLVDAGLLAWAWDRLPGLSAVP
jgi:uncharacterized membrane protein YsdA (DUF1294 family)